MVSFLNFFSPKCAFISKEKLHSHFLKLEMSTKKKQLNNRTKQTVLYIPYTFKFTSALMKVHRFKCGIRSVNIYVPTYIGVKRVLIGHRTKAQTDFTIWELTKSHFILIVLSKRHLIGCQISVDFLTDFIKQLGREKHVVTSVKNLLQASKKTNFF